MSTQSAYDDSRTDSEMPDPYYPVMPSEALLEWGRQLVEVPRWYE